MKFSRAVYTYTTEKNCVFYSIDLEPSLLMEQINQYIELIKYQVHFILKSE